MDSEELKIFEYYADNLESLIQIANDGNVNAQISLATMYENGVSEKLRQDDKESIKWWTMAANSGYENAQLKLAFCYLEGHMVAKNAITAAKWLQVAADKENADAQFVLASLFVNGEIGNRSDKDFETASILLLKAANQEHQGAIDLIKHFQTKGNR